MLCCVRRASVKLPESIVIHHNDHRQPNTQQHSNRLSELSIDKHTDKPQSWERFTDPSLRAGKVKSQTPKVEPQEKKKRPKGRAAKREKFTRRFVNVTLTGGKRKMNPGA
ncbi:hypothetical protein DID88_005203 [Monilinia fructigena]|uniref:Uncharacterized protein n=1 Tax=Monilinia fructigena TaxID=38457 RepID=A0A395IDT8_9HELO|nr:hypothetical protein DID88_005203 [Monilinia fructigena]